MHRLAERAENILDRLEGLLPPAEPATDWTSAVAFRWVRNGTGRGRLEPIRHPHRLTLAQLRNIDDQKSAVDRNTRQFLRGLPANNVLLWGSRGTGKSSLVKALLNEYADEGLRIIEVDKQDMLDLPQLVDRLQGRPERFLLFCDDLSFEADDASYKALKAVLDGSLAHPPENVLIYATSNRRHLLPEYMQENESSRMVDGEIHHGEAVEEKISLSERFGLWISFYPFSQDRYLEICRSWLETFDLALDAQAREAALQYALARGSRSGRVAWQFARDFAGRKGLEG
ncbi:ATP-binding protein [Ectothiorhodospiraceae bacterium WFHF3C12]|nr:ATP-binding protein [Ectothiorhodospiraceae bacterium WFHF3C12]